MEEQKDLPKPQTDLPLPEKEIPAHTREGAVSMSKWLKLGALLIVLLLIGGSAYLLGKNNANKEIACTTEAKICPDGSSVGRAGPKCEFSPCPTPTPDPTANWKTYKIDSVNITYQLPPYFNQYGDMNERIVPGTKGGLHCITYTDLADTQKAYCNTYHFGIALSSADYIDPGLGRSYIFSDIRGYSQQNGKYYAKFSNISIQIPIEKVKIFKTDNTLSIIKVVGGSEEPNPTVPNNGVIGAIVNTNNSSYPGLNIEMVLKDGLTEKDFDQILSTFKFTK